MDYGLDSSIIPLLNSYFGNFTVIMEGSVFPFWKRTELFRGKGAQCCQLILKCVHTHTKGERERKSKCNEV